jgi:hypothetical protein
MRPGIRITEETVGTGAEATKDKVVIINQRTLPLDEKDLSDVPEPWRKVKINLARRDAGAGLRYGVEGMRVGGRRVFIMSPSLSCCPQPLRCEVELLEVRDDMALRPEEYLPGKHLCIVHPGELSRSLAKWLFELSDDGNYRGRVTPARPGLIKWRHSRDRNFMGNIDPAQVATLLNWVMEFPLKYPDQITSRVHNLGGDSSWYLDTRKEVVCLGVDVRERGQSVSNYYVPETSVVWGQSELQQLIGGLIKPAPPKG